METITKTKFKNILTNSKSIFLGISNKILTKEELKDKAEYCCKREGLEKRTCVEKGKYLFFSNGSSLCVNNTEYEEHTTLLYDYDNCIVLVDACKWYDEYDDEYTYKCLHYVIKK